MKNQVGGLDSLGKGVVVEYDGEVEMPQDQQRIPVRDVQELIDRFRGDSTTNSRNGEKSASEENLRSRVFEKFNGYRENYINLLKSADPIKRKEIFKEFITNEYDPFAVEIEDPDNIKLGDEVLESNYESNLTQLTTILNELYGDEEVAEIINDISESKNSNLESIPLFSSNDLIGRIERSIKKKYEGSKIPKKVNKFLQEIQPNQKNDGNEQGRISKLTYLAKGIVRFGSRDNSNALQQGQVEDELLTLNDLQEKIQTLKTKFINETSEDYDEIFKDDKLLNIDLQDDDMESSSLAKLQECMGRISTIRQIQSSDQFKNYKELNKRFTILGKIESSNLLEELQTQTELYWYLKLSKDLEEYSVANVKNNRGEVTLKSFKERMGERFSLEQVFIDRFYSEASDASSLIEAFIDTENIFARCIEDSPSLNNKTIHYHVHHPSMIDIHRDIIAYLGFDQMNGDDRLKAISQFSGKLTNGFDEVKKKMKERSNQFGSTVSNHMNDKVLFSFDGKRRIFTYGDTKFKENFDQVVSYVFGDSSESQEDQK